jgi:monoamine oxidase
MRSEKRSFPRMRSYRTPLFGELRRALALARLTNRPGGPGVGELIEQAREARLTRREALSVSAASALAVVGASRRAESGLFFRRSQCSAPRVVVVGAGIAGLVAAFELDGAGVRPRVFEAAERLGGRIVSSRDLLAPGLVTEFGAEFIDSGHKALLALVHKFGLELIDNRQAADGHLLREAYYFGGAHHTAAQAAEAFRPLAKQIEDDQDDAGKPQRVRDNPDAREWDETSIADYLDEIGAEGWIRRLIEVAVISEYGLECDNLSALNLLWLIAARPAEGAGGFELFADHDERYKVRGGNHLIIEKLAERLGQPVALGHRLEAIHGAGDGGFRLDFAVANSRSVGVEADFVVLALPFSVLRKVELRVELPPRKKRAIAELGYGTNAKLALGFRRRVWRERGYAGAVYTDAPFQTAWDSSRFQPGTAGVLTMLPGAAAGLALGAGTPADQARRLLSDVERIYPEAASAYNGRAERYHWPTAPFALGSYASYKVGQWTALAGAEGEPVGNLFFAGEHCLFGDSGFMNSAVLSGQKAARALLARADGR